MATPAEFGERFRVLEGRLGEGGRDWQGVTGDEVATFGSSPTRIMLRCWVFEITRFVEPPMGNTELPNGCTVREVRTWWCGFRWAPS